jgi:uncharacterized protein (TIGR02246 family)
VNNKLWVLVALVGGVHCSASFAQQTAAPAVQSPTEEKSSDENAATPVEPFPADVAAIRAGSEAFVAAFNKHDATGLAALWTADGEYIDDSGRTITGRDAIEQDYAAFFTENPNVEIKMQIDSLRVISGDVAMEQGRAIVQPPPAGAPGVSSYSVVHAKLDGKWLMASVRDTWIETQATPESIADIGWLIGSWTAEEHGVKNESVCRPVAGGHFIERTYTTTLLDGTTISGVQLIGWNPLEGRVQSWSFSPDGGHDIGVWSPTHDGWMSVTRGVTGAGVPTSSVNLLKRLDDNAHAWQSIQRFVGARSLPDTDEVVVKRQASEPAHKQTTR